MNAGQSPLVAVDVGNSRTKLGLFTEIPPTGLPSPTRILELSTDTWDSQQIRAWLGEMQNRLDPQTLQWRIASVHRAASTRLLEWIETEFHDGGKHQGRAMSLDWTHFPLAISVAQPERVGLDRLCGALAANRLRQSGTPAIVADLGTALTVDVISAEGAFLGGAILPGIGMSARALHDFTDQLPLIAMTDLHDAPAPLGVATESAMRSGLYWGAVGAMRELIARLTPAGTTPAQVFLTGGAAPVVAGVLGAAVQYVPHLVLGGIALTAVPE